MNIKIVERYTINTGINRFDLYKTYNDVSDVIDTVYVLNIDGKDSYTQYKTKEEAEHAALKYNTQEYINELQNNADSKLKELVKFRGRLSYLNTVYRTWKDAKGIMPKGLSYIGKDLIDSFNEENPVITLLPPQEKAKCYIVLIKDHLKKRIEQYYKYKKEYLDIKKKIKQAKQKLNMQANK